MKPLFLLNAPLSFPAEALFQQALTSAGWRQHDCEIGYATEAVAATAKSRLIVAFGDGAAGACVAGDWERGWCQERRGYLWQGAASDKVLTTLDPEDCVLRQDPSGINGMLLVADLERAKREAKFADYRRISRRVTVITETTRSAAQSAISCIKSAGTSACDIECSDASTLLCIGFATSATEAFVFVGEALVAALQIVADLSVSKVFQNGQFDAYFLKTRCGVEVANWTDDCMIAWHALWPEIAGKGAKGSKRTRKSLAFLASLYTESPEWWKEYDTDEAGMYQLNGLDCCITYEIMQNLKREIAEQDVAAIYAHEMSMMPVLVAIQERGLAVDEIGRQRAAQELGVRRTEALLRIRELAEPILRERRISIEKPHLFYGTARCSCCNGGAKKSAACWACAGFAKQPGKRQLGDIVLAPCAVCNGAGRFDTFDFNPASTAQQVELFYNVLNLPQRYNDGSLTCDEKALKGLLAEVAG